VFPTPDERDWRAIDAFMVFLLPSMIVIDGEKFKEMISRWMRGLSAASMHPRMPTLWWCAHPFMAAAQASAQSSAQSSTQGSAQGKAGPSGENADATPQPSAAAAPAGAVPPMGAASLPGGIGTHFIDKAQVALYYAVLAVGYRLLRAGPGSLGISGPPADAVTRSEEHFETARALAFSLLDQPCMDLLRALMLLAHYTAGSVRLTQSSLITSYAWRVARACGLSVADGYLGTAMRLWRVLVCFDLDPLPVGPRMLPAWFAASRVGRSEEEKQRELGELAEQPPHGHCCGGDAESPSCSPVCKCNGPTDMFNYAPSSTSAAFRDSPPPASATRSRMCPRCSQAVQDKINFASYSHENGPPLHVPAHFVTEAMLASPAGASINGNISALSGLENASRQSTCRLPIASASFPTPEVVAAAKSLQIPFDKPSGSLSIVCRRSDGMVRVAADEYMTVHYVYCRAMEVLGEAMNRFFLQRRGALSPEGLEKAWAYTDELLDLACLPDCRMSAALLAMIFGLKAFCVQQSGNAAAAAAWATQSAHIWIDIPICEMSHSFLFWFFVKHVSLLVLSRELSEAVQMLHHDELSTTKIREEGASLFATPSADPGSLTAQPRPEVNGDNLVDLPPLSSFRLFTSLMVMMASACLHWPLSILNFQAITTEAAAMHSAARCAFHAKARSTRSASIDSSIKTDGKDIRESTAPGTGTTWSPATEPDESDKLALGTLPDLPSMAVGEEELLMSVNELLDSRKPLKSDRDERMFYPGFIDPTSGELTGLECLLEYHLMTKNLFAPIMPKKKEQVPATTGIVQRGIISHGGKAVINSTSVAAAAADASAESSPLDLLLLAIRRQDGAPPTISASSEALTDVTKPATEDGSLDFLDISDSQ
jgi:hypothetical protein